MRRRQRVLMGLGSIQNLISVSLDHGGSRKGEGEEGDNV